MKIGKFNIIKDKLTNRYNSIICDDQYTFHSSIAAFMNFIDEEKFFRIMFDQMNLKYDFRETIKQLLLNNGRGSYYTRLEEQATYSFLLIGSILEEKDSDLFFDVSYKHSITDQDFYSILSKFKDRFIKPIYIFLVESIASENYVLSILLQYKHKSEWFLKKSLINIWKNDTKKGEKLLAWNLYEYLFDNGIEFSIEPVSKEGIVDVISAQIGENKLIADAKIFNGDRKYIIDSLNQIYTYTKIYNEQSGFLVIFKVCEVDLLLKDFENEQKIQYFTHNNKNLYFLIIDIHEYVNTASKRGKLSAIEINKQDLITYIEG